MSKQRSLFTESDDGYGHKSYSFDGETFDADRDGARLGAQLEAVRTLMADGQWRTLREIAVSVGGSEAGVSARLRDLRKQRFGAMPVDRRYAPHLGHGIWEYRIKT